MLVALVATVLVACGAGATAPAPPTPPGGANNPYALLATLRQEPAAALQMPGGNRLGGGGDERYQTIRGPRPASITSVYGTGDTQEAVFAYYDGELRALGYTDATIGFAPSQVEVAICGWCKPQTATLRLTIKNQATAFPPSYLQGRTYTTVFETRLTGLTQADFCPAPQQGTPIRTP